MWRTGTRGLFITVLTLSLAGCAGAGLFRGAAKTTRTAVGSTVRVAAGGVRSVGKLATKPFRKDETEDGEEAPE
jgi:hypothetical protein